MRTLLRPRRPFGTPVALLVILAALVAPSSALGTPFSNTSAIVIPTSGTANLYPSPITPTGLTGTVSKVTVTLNGFHHAFIADADILVVAPNNVGVVVMSDACSFFMTTAPVTLTFDDDAIGVIPPTACSLILNTSKPNNNQDALLCDADPDVFPAPAPPGPSAGGYPIGIQMLSTFNGMSAATAMGAWKLFVLDDCAGDGGGIDNGWTLDIQTMPTAVTLLSFTARPVAGHVLLSWRTASESGIAGFNVFRSGASGTIRVNPALVEAVGVFGGTYRLVDRTARAGMRYTYRLQIVHRDGTRSWYQTVRVVARP